jgi:hypothetical protein
MGVFETIYNQSPGPCRVMQVNGSEDIVLLHNGHAFVSSVRGAILLRSFECIYL